MRGELGCDGKNFGRMARRRMKMSCTQGVQDGATKCGQRGQRGAKL